MNTLPCRYESRRLLTIYMCFQVDYGKRWVYNGDEGRGESPEKCNKNQGGEAQGCPVPERHIRDPKKNAGDCSELVFSSR